jgi:hypothetical protein
MADRARPLLALGRGLRPGLDVRLPAWDEAFERDGLVRAAPAGIGERAWWRHQLIARVPPPSWEAWLGVKPTELISRAARSDDGRAVLVAWAEATVATRDTRWAQALLERAEVTQPALGEAVAGLVEVLPAGLAEDAVGAHLELLVAAAVVVVPGPWSTTFGRRILDRIANDRDPSPSAQTRALVRIAAQRLPAVAAGDLELAVRGDRPPHVVNAAFGEAFEYIRLREQMARAFDTAG